MKNYKDLKRFAEAEGFYVISTNGGRHNRNSKHYPGLAIDVRTYDKKNREDLIEKAGELSKQGKTQREIAAELELSPTTVNKYLKEL